MTTFRRAQVETLVSRLLEPPERLIAIFGPRQSGKTTAARQALEAVPHERRFLGIDQPDPTSIGPPPSGPRLPAVSSGAPTSRSQRDIGWLVDTWAESHRRAWDSNRGFVLVLDEIQRIEGWSDTVKGLWDADRASGCPLHVVIMGSAPLLMQSGLSESVAGRFEPIQFTHWSYSEMADAFGFSLDEYVYFGGYPGATRYVDDPQRWVTYVKEALIEPNIERDVLSMTRVDKPALLRRLFELGALVLRAGAVLQQDARTASGRGQCHHTGALSEAPIGRRSVDWAGQAHRATRVSQSINTQAERVEHGTHGRDLPLLLRGSSGRPHPVGSASRERGRCASCEHGIADDQRQVLAGQALRGRLRAPPGAAHRRDRSEERSGASTPEGDRRVRAPVQPSKHHGCRRHGRATVRVPVSPR